MYLFIHAYWHIVVSFFAFLWVAGFNGLCKSCCAGARTHALMSGAQLHDALQVGNTVGPGAFPHVQAIFRRLSSPKNRSTGSSYASRAPICQHISENVGFHVLHLLINTQKGNKTNFHKDRKEYKMQRSEKPGAGFVPLQRRGPTRRWASRC